MNAARSYDDLEDSPEVREIQAIYLRACGWVQEVDGGWSHKDVPRKDVDISYALAVQIVKHRGRAA